MALPPVARMVETPSWRMRRPVASMEGSSIHWTQPAGAPAATAASRTTRAASAEQCCAEGWKAKTIGLRVLRAMSALKTVVEVGLVTGVIAQTTPTGSAISVMPFSSSRRITPAVFRPAIEWVTCSQAKRFLTALSSKRPRPVSSTARRASSPWAARAASDAFLTMWSTRSWSRASNSASAPSARPTSPSTISLASMTGLLHRSLVSSSPPFDTR